MPPKEILKITPSEMECEGIFSDLSPFNAPMDTGIQNILKCYYYLHAYIHAVIQLLFISIFRLLPAIAINAIVK